ncbi:MAG TPA: hypothetical protein PKH79_13070 [Prolixibacteraceae bacterium]|nr:hypothetical protein [Prolixibacteraceae bacterium]HPS12798.1 hypothetical protein [Prolixibacteraceae bacterium]
MKVNFFDTPCKEPARIDPLFGICDDQDGVSKAYTDHANQNKWIATVINKNQTEVFFTPIDHCFSILREGSKEEESLCDGMLTFQSSLYLVELKEKEKHAWQLEALTQLENTIRLLQANHDLSVFKYKKVYACNKKHPFFKAIDNETSKRFFKNSDGFRIDVQAEITIK